MIRKILCFCLLITAGCGGNENMPAGILSEDEMTSILMEVYITEAKINSYQPRLPRDSSTIVFEVLKKDILEEHNTNDSVFKESMSWYFERPERLEIIYSRLTDSLNLEVQKFREPKSDK